MLLPALLLAAAVAASDSTEYVVLNHGRRAGEMVVVQGGDSVVVRYRHVDRNRGTRSETRYRLAPDGTPIAGETRPVGLNDGIVGEPADRFEVVADSVRWGVARERHAVHRDSGYYRLRRGTAFDEALLVRQLLRRPDSTLRLLPAGQARLEIAGDTVVHTATGAQHVRLALIHTVPGGTPAAVWIDDAGELFASDVGWFITVRAGAEDALPALRAKEVAYRNAQGAALARRVMPPPASAIAIVNGDVFDAERGVVRPRTTVVVRGERIVAVGPADSVAVPTGATVIDATGRTVVPGLWDMHGHMQLTSQTSSGIRQLAQGITTVRDLASDVDVATSHRDRAAAGEIVGPRAVLAGFIEGPGLWAGPTDVIVRTEEEARAWVARYDSLGYRQIKVYNLVHPDLIPTIAEEAHRRGMRLSGHVPRGLSTPAAVRLGFDEINHAAFLFSTFYPDSLFTPTMRAYSLVAQTVAPNIDVESPEMTAMIELFRERGTVIDGTFAIWMQEVGGGPGPAGLPAAADSARVAAANAHWVRLIQRLHDAGVTMVPGTDNQGSGTYLEELELYERAGIPTAEVLQMATIVPARVMKDARDYGSIAPGKVADLVIVNGRPAERIGDLRRVERVLRAGRVYDPRALRAAIGLGSGRGGRP
ncbi:MAG TPA: amidohydrolase family protein [Gemmatimonadaceae bacterium]|nr:amidohydrolase family protein [Gemmatimonadaceae bacterium]